MIITRLYPLSQFTVLGPNSFNRNVIHPQFFARKHYVFNSPCSFPQYVLGLCLLILMTMRRKCTVFSYCSELCNNMCINFCILMLCRQFLLITYRYMHAYVLYKYYTYVYLHIYHFGTLD